MTSALGTARRARAPSELPEQSAANSQFRDECYERIVKAIYQSLEKNGIEKTTIQGIARSAGLSRATIYKYFSRKEDIIARVSLIETEKTTSAIRSLINRGGDLSETLTDCLALCVRLSYDNPYVGILMSSPGVVSRTANPKTPAHGTFKRQWGSLLEVAYTKASFIPTCRWTRL